MKYMKYRYANFGTFLGGHPVYIADILITHFKRLFVAYALVLAVHLMECL